MVPLRDDNPVKITPYVTYGLIIVNVLVFLYELSLAPPQLEQFFRVWAVVPRDLTLTLEGAAVAESLSVRWWSRRAVRNRAMTERLERR